METSKIADELRKIRIEKLKEHQENRRLAAFEKHRFDDDELISEHDIHGLCSRIKRRKAADDEDLRKLGSAFIQSEENIIAFIRVTGAINVIVKEFTGNDRNQQILAAQCICNLSLGNDICCFKLATFAGSYLSIAMLNINDTQLSKICLWTAQNIVETGGKGLDVLMSQMLLRNCLNIANNSIELEEEAVLLLDLIVEKKWNEINFEDRKYALQTVTTVMRKNFNNVTYLRVFVRLSEMWEMNVKQIEEFIIMMSMNLIEANDHGVVFYSLNILHLLSRSHYEIFVKSFEFLMQSDVKVSQLINKAVNNPKYFPFIKNYLRFLAKAPSEYFAFDPLENLQIPKFFQLS